jgi:hypothetical protein
MSVAMKSTPLSRKFSRKAALQASRSSLTMSRVAPSLRQRPMALASSCRSLRLPVDLGELGEQVPVTPVQVVHDRVALGIHPQPVDALLGGAHPIIGDEFSSHHLL